VEETPMEQMDPASVDDVETTRFTSRTSSDAEWIAA